MQPVLGELKIKHGEVTYRGAIEGRPAHFHVAFTIDCTFTSDSIESHNVFYWNVAVPGLGPDATYSEIENTAARQIAPMLRLMADDLEAREAKKTEALKEKPATG